MFAKIRHNKSVRNTIVYHEKKLKHGVAEILAAGNFAKELTELDLKDKLFHFQRLSSLHESITSNVVHISLNFHPKDRLTNGDMVNIAHRYMEKVGYGDQPYLVYRHYDRPHPHFHVVSTNIQQDGKLLELRKRDYLNALRLTRQVEEEYRLIQSGEWKRHHHTVGHALKVDLNKMSTMPALSNVIDKVVPLYKCTSMEELNAVLRLYNVVVMEGREHSHLRHYKGLMYSALDDEGRLVGMPVKASLFESRPILRELERRFVQNQADVQRQQHRQRVTAMLEWNMTKKGMDLPTLQKTLERQRISVVRMKDNVFYIDHETRAVFDGQQLGQRYNVQALQQRLMPVQEQEQKQVLKHHQRHHHTIMHDL